MAMLRKMILTLAVVTAFSNWSCASPHHDPSKALWAHAQQAIAQRRFDVAFVTLRTLLNTYPHSKYAPSARQALRDPRIVAICTERKVWFNPPLCDDLP
jgi:hypothetical protein